MSTTAHTSAAELARAFDEVFAKERISAAAETENLMAIRVGDEPYALRVREISGLTLCGKVVPVPGGTPALMGIANLRGALLPVFSLPALLGFDQAGANLRWLAVCGTRDPIGLAFSVFEHYFAVPPSDVSIVESGEMRNHARELVRTSAAMRLIINIPSVTKTIYSRAVPAGPDKER
jgi:purine-binding chemotaxis protein CheW